MTNKTFHVTISGEYSLELEHIWPDGDAPENPTPEDVMKIMKESASSPLKLCSDWNLPVGVTVEMVGERNAYWED